MSRAPFHRTLNPVVWTLARLNGRTLEHLGVFSGDLRAKAQAVAIIAKEAGLHHLRLDVWTPLPDGGQEVVFAQPTHTWRFRVRPECLDGEAG